MLPVVPNVASGAITVGTVGTGDDCGAGEAAVGVGLGSSAVTGCFATSVMFASAADFIAGVCKEQGVSV